MFRSIGGIRGTKRGRFAQRGVGSGAGEFEKWESGLKGNRFGFGRKCYGRKQCVGESRRCHLLSSVK